jgi:hypothetical protein
MGNYSIKGQKYLHLPSGAVCIVLADFPDRHRVRIQLVENGREMDEVAYHDMGPFTEAPAPSEPSVESPGAPVEEATAADPTEETYPRRGRAEWNRGTRREQPRSE